MRGSSLALLTLLAMGPFEKNDPRVAQGMEAFDRGQYDDALKAFDEAGKEHPKSPVLEFDRGNALYKLGRMEDARNAYQHVTDLDRGELGAKDYYNLGNAWARLGKDKEAIAAFRKSLTLDPTDAQARHNLEVILRKVPPPKQQTPDGGTDGGSNRDGGHPDAGGADGGRDAGTDGGTDGGRGADGGGGDAGQGDGGQGQGQQKPSDGGEGSSSGRSDGGASDGGQDSDGGAIEEPKRPEPDGGASEGRLSKEEAERLLNSMKRDERNLQMWRFQQHKPRKSSEKDW